jgi:hypothetical protein
MTPPPPGSDGVDHFLFETRSGFFDYHASAMAVLLRAAGVPARVATGFALDEFDNETGQFVLRESNSYTWPEVYFPGQGWVAFNPSPDRPSIARGEETADEELGGSATGRDPDLPIPNGPRRGAFVEPQNQNPIEPIATAEEGMNPLWWALAGVAGLLVVGGVGGRLLWERGLAGHPYAARAWVKTVRLASWLRLGPRPAQTPNEYAREFTSRVPRTAPITTIADAYTRSKWGRPGQSETPEERERVASAWKSLRTRLFARFFRLR